ncbi:MAG: sigma-70 family RNA polymerase sigma factor [Verrucomicrobiota bacterium]
MPDPTDQNDSHETFVRLLTKHEPEVRAYIRDSVPSGNDVAEIMQDASLVALRKFGDLENPEQDFGKWLCVIARFEILKFRQTKARDRLVLGDDLVEKIAHEGLEESAQRNAWIEALEKCLARLPESRRHLITEAYGPGASIKEMAVQQQKKPDAIYQLLRRIRIELATCIEGRMTNNP